MSTIHTDTLSVIMLYGGEEFLVLAPDSSVQAAAALGDRMIRAFNDRILTLPDGTNLSVTASIGVAQYDLEETCMEFLARADGALYDAKRGGRNRLHIALSHSLQ
jgi:diguanylate cyclase (GGDEF)-like protein